MCAFEAESEIKKLGGNNDQNKIGGLQWSNRSHKDMDWDSAMAYCDNLEEGGYSDWTLPSQDVLKNFYNGKGSSKLGDTGTFWSSCNGACYINFSNGSYGINIPKSRSYSVRCVRW